LVFVFFLPKILPAENRTLEKKKGIGENLADDCNSANNVTEKTYVEKLQRHLHKFNNVKYGKLIATFAIRLRITRRND
jgi:hypothetical protein